METHFLLKEEKGNFASSKGNIRTPFSCIQHLNNEPSLTGEKPTQRDRNNQDNYTAMRGLGFTQTSNRHRADIPQRYVKCTDTVKARTMLQVTFRHVSDFTCILRDVMLISYQVSAPLHYRSSAEKLKEMKRSDKTKSAVKDTTVDPHTNDELK